MVLQAYSLLQEEPASFLLGLNLSPSSFIDSLLLLHWKTEWTGDSYQNCVPLTILDLSYPFQVPSFSRLESPMLLNCTSYRRYCISLIISLSNVSVSHIQVTKWILLQIVRGISVSNLVLLGFSQMLWILGNSSNLSIQVHRKDPVSSIGCIWQLTDTEDCGCVTFLYPRKQT